MKKTFVFSLCATMTILAACNESENWTPNTGCSDGDARCDSDKLYTCKDGEWVLGTNCADSGKFCGQNAENKPACVSGPKEECVPSCKDGVVTLCDSDGNVMTHQCTEGQVCGLNPQGTPGCVTMPQKSCTPYCKNDGIVKCDADMNEVFEACEGNTICSMDENRQPACVEKKSCMPSCLNGVLTTCDADMNEVTTSCSDENKVCGYNEFGVPACVDAAKSCTPSCVNGVLTTCDADMNESTKSCLEDSKICGVNENGVPACVDAVVCAFGETNILIGTKVCDAEGKVWECQADGTMSEGTACTEGVCNEGKCVRRDCDDVADGKNICKENKLMVCSDGQLVEDTENACANDTPLCRDGEAACSAYKACDTIEHGKTGCQNGNIVSCNDGATSVIDGGDCVTNAQFCTADENAESGFACVTPDPGDCEWTGGIVAKNETVCDGNKLRVCSAETDNEFSAGVDCDAVNNGKPFCDPKLNICRAYFNCGDNDEIAHDSIVCNAKGTNKAKCVDGKLVDLTDADACTAGEHAVSVCTFDTEAACSFVCEPGYFLKNNACEPIVTCDAVKEIYNKDDNTCSCNEGAFWTGTAGSCDCKDGYLLIGNTCVKKEECSLAHSILDETSNICVCDNANHWIGDAESCQCKDGFVEIGSECKSIVDCTEEHTVWVKETNACVCDDTKGWMGTVGSCACAEGFVNVDGVCVRKAVCSANETWFESDNTCTCNVEKGWTGTAGSCTCSDSTQVPAGDSCENKVECTEGQMYVDGLNVCACDSAKSWISDGTSCVCPTGYFAKDGVCIPKAICDLNMEKYVESTNTCECDSDKGLSGTAGNCTCADGLFFIDNQCIKLTEGDLITFGHYEQDNDTSNGQEPITWRVLDKNADGQYLLISEKALDVQPYNTTFISITWEKSTIRSWLNGYDQSYNTAGKNYTSDNFIDAAFTTAEKAQIVSSNVPAHANPYYSTSPGNATNDRIFLLSITEAQNYFTNSDNFKVDATRYAVKKGAYVLGSESGKYTSNGTCTDVHCLPLWWLRSPGYDNRSTASVYYDGSIYYYGSIVDYDNITVRPALWVNH